MSLRLKIVLIGDAQCGKTTFVQRHRSGNFTRNYTPTLGVEVSPIVLETNQGIATLNMWDCAGQEKYKGLGNGYYNGADACIIFFDLTRPETHRNVPKYIEEFRQVSDAPIIICGNKVDIRKRKVKASQINYPEFSYFDLSSYSNYNYEKPLLWALRLTGNPHIQLV